MYFLWKTAGKQHFAGAVFASGEELSHGLFHKFNTLGSVC